MREIKFRQPVFDNKGKFHSFHYWGILSEGHFQAPLNQIETWGLSQQFTGLLDKNAKEIFEGDVVEILAEDNKINRFIIKYGIAERKMASGWIVDIPSFYFESTIDGFKAFPIVLNYKGIHDLEMMEVIGNIYEHGHLIEANKC